MSRYWHTVKYLRFNSQSISIRGHRFSLHKNIEILPKKKEFTVVRIAPSGFAGKRRLERIIIPFTVKSIGECAFYNCTSLREVILPELLSDIECKAFARCSMVTSFKLPLKLKKIQRSTFEDCTSLSEINLSRIEVIEPLAFRNCRSLAFVDIQNATAIADGAFSSCTALSDIKMPSKACNISVKAFDGCPIVTSDLFWKNDLLIVDGWLLACKSQGDYVTIDADVKYIAHDAFENIIRDLRVPDPKYEENLKWYDEQLFLYHNWYHCPGSGPIADPGEPPKKFLDVKVPIKIHYNGTLADWEQIVIATSADAYPVEIMAKDGCKQTTI